MEIYKIITAKGSGFWSKSYEINLETFTWVYHDRHSKKSIEVLKFELAFRVPGTKEWDRRIFNSENERSSFLSQSFNELEIELINKPNPLLDEYYPQNLVGEKVTKITFDLGYIDMHFNDQNIQFSKWPLINIAEEEYNSTDKEYRNMFSDLIGDTVILVDEYLDLGLTIEFDTGTYVHVSLRDDQDFKFPEIAIFSGPNNNLFIWGVGNKPFD